MDLKVLDYEEIIVPAGKFSAYKIERKGWSIWNTSFRGGRVEEVYWIEPNWGVKIKSTYKFFAKAGPNIYETTELESFVRGGAVSATQPVASEATRVASR